MFVEWPAEAPTNADRYAILLDMNIAIIGFGREGKAAYDYYNTGEHKITICDQKTDISDLPDDVTTQLGPDYLHNLSKFDLIVRSPFVRPDAILNANDAATAAKITTNYNEFMSVSPSQHVIGVTGTKGKGTTSTLLTRILQAAGNTVHLGGNIGIPAFDLLKNDIQPSDWVVLELSSYQLLDARVSPPIGVCLMMIPEHLDWHASEQEYFTAKQQLFRYQAPEDVAVYYADNPVSKQTAAVSHGVHVPYMAAPGAYVAQDAIQIDGNRICAVSDVALPGAHNLQNVCAAITAAWQVTQDVAAIASAVKSFSGLPYRIEHRATIGGIDYVNDSFATNSGATLAAIAAIQQPKVLLIGGYDRGLALDQLARALADTHNNIRHVVLFGQSAQRVADVLPDTVPVTMSHATTMQELVTVATSQAQPGDAVVLSPSFASFDMFDNFEARGNAFNDAVTALQKENV